LKYKIGDRIKDNRRDITIINIRRHNGRLQYKYKCNICGYNCGYSYKDGIFQEEYWIDSSHLNDGVGCSCCQGRAVVPGVNNVGFTNANVAKYIKNNYDKMRFTQSSRKKVDVICPLCHNSRLLCIVDINPEHFFCPFCSDKMPLGEKIVYLLLTMLNVKFIKEYSSGNSNWTGKYRYDFFIPEDIIIEVMGSQHKHGTFYHLNGKNAIDEQINDFNKRTLALKNGIKTYITIDADKSDFDYIKNSIINSKLSEILDISKIDWMLIREKSTKTIVKDICDIWNSDINITTSDLKNKFGLSYNAVQTYLKQGKKLGWCNYDVKKYRKKNIYINDSVNTSTPIKCIENNKYFKSIGLCCRLSKNIFGVQLNDCSIRSVLNGNYSHHKKLSFFICLQRRI